VSLFKFSFCSCVFLVFSLSFAARALNKKRRKRRPLPLPPRNKHSGDPPNIIIGTALSRYLGFVDFLIHMAPGVIVAFIVCVPLILWMDRSLIGRIPDFDKVLEAAADYRITDWSLFWKCVFVLGVVLLGFLLHPIHHLELSECLCFFFFLR
jgi:hypothetical protein